MSERMMVWMMLTNLEKSLLLSIAFTGPRNRYGWSHFFESKNIVNFLNSKVYTIIRRHLLTGKYVATLDLEIINPY